MRQSPRGLALIIPAGIVSIALVAIAACSTHGDTPRPPASGAVAFAPPDDSTIADDPVGRATRRGLALLTHTHDSLPSYVGAALRCVSCHPDNGRRPGAMPWVGVAARFPQYRSRSASIALLEDRINDCFERSLNGRSLPAGSDDMRDIVAYMTFLSKGVPVGSAVEGQGLARLALTTGDSARGATVFVTQCTRCHGPGGEGTVIAPPLWGPHSFNIGAGMARLGTAAAFIRHNMPFDRPGSLTDQEAIDVAAYIVAQPRPDFAGKERDWPEGGAPPDVAYQTEYQRQHPGAGRR